MPDFDNAQKIFDKDGNLEDDTLKKGKTNRDDLRD
jgi:hypothetical protein